MWRVLLHASVLAWILLLLHGHWVLRYHHLRHLEFDVHAIVLIAVWVPCCRLGLIEHPLSINNELVLVHTWVRHLQQKLEVLVANAVHRNLLPFCEGASDVNLVSMVCPLEQVLAKRLRWWLLDYGGKHVRGGVYPRVLLHVAWLLVLLSWNCW